MGNDMALKEMVAHLEMLTGQPIPDGSGVTRLQGSDTFTPLISIGYSQFNEILLNLGLDRVTYPFFAYLTGSAPTETRRVEIPTIADLRCLATRFAIDAMLLHGNIKFAFNRMSRMTGAELERELLPRKPVAPVLFETRHDPVVPIEPIKGDEAYYLGYIVERELNAKVASGTADDSTTKKLRRLEEVRAIGRRNHAAYLTSDHLDVYVATSMRHPHEFKIVADLNAKIFNDPLLQPLKLRWFDPTLAYCDHRIDKGLVEALMLKRAKCTLYHVQETDTLGKDSELASTLAQGKPVVAFVPEITDTKVFATWIRKLSRQMYPGHSTAHLALRFLRVFDPFGAWDSDEVRAWLNDPQCMDVDAAVRRLVEKAKVMYDGRAKTLSEDHPLGLQVNLDTGVANGVLVVRSSQQCADIMYQIMTNTLQFELECKATRDGTMFYLREATSKCVYRVVTADRLLTNSFWNFYLDPAERP